MKKIICGIQQIGIGVKDLPAALRLYKENFGMEVKMFDDKGTAELMLPYTGGKPQERHAYLVLNMQGGSGFEVWNYTTRTPLAPEHTVEMGDYGIFATKIKTPNIKKAYAFLKSKHMEIVSEIAACADCKPNFWTKDPFDNYFQIVEDDCWFDKGKHPTGGPCGVVIGVSNMEKSIDFYQNVLNYDKIIFDKTDVFDNLKNIAGGKEKFRRVLLTNSQHPKGAFSPVLGNSYIELVQKIDKSAKKIFKNRFWGDLGFIHLCFDIRNMEALKADCQKYGSPFTVDSGKKFDMGEAAGRFAYIEDPDGTLIEFVETFKIPIIKKLGLYIDLSKKNPEKSLPKWMLKLLKYNKLKI